MSTFPRSDFTANLLSLNQPLLDGFAKWLFKPGTGYGDHEKWWDRNGDRPTGHQGVDFVNYLDGEGREHRLGAGAAIPPLFPGRPAMIVGDFLGRTVVIEHDIRDGNGNILHTFHAHLIPAPSLEIGRSITGQEDLGAVAPGSERCPGHLHISTAWVAEGYLLADFGWTDFSEMEGFHPCNPLDFLQICDDH